MAYLEKADYTISVSHTHLDEILSAAVSGSGKAEDVVRQEAEDTAEAQIRSYTQAKYDVATEFAKTAPDATRARMIIKCMVDISLYHLHFTINPRNIPKLRADAYDNCIEHLKAIQKGTMVLVGVDEVESPLNHTFINSQIKFVSKPHQDLSL